MKSYNKMPNLNGLRFGEKVDQILIIFCNIFKERPKMQLQF